MKINERLIVIAREIERGKTMADIGTDHGFLPIYLLRENVCPMAIATDISSKSLSKAKREWENILNKDDNLGTFITRVGDGLKVIKPEEVDYIVIAGMGGILIGDIIGENIEHSKTFENFILQPRNNTGKLRKKLWEIGFKVNKDIVVKEGKFYPIIMVVSKNTDNENITKYLGIDSFELGKEEINLDIYWDYPDSLINNKNEFTVDFLKQNLKKEKIIISKINDNGKNNKYINYHIKRMERIQEILKKVR